MNFQSISETYRKTEKQSVNEHSSDYEIVAKIFDELIRSMNIYSTEIVKENSNQKVKSEHFARTLTIIYTLQSSLDFEKGGEIANNLFQLYEYARVKVIDDMRNQSNEGTKNAIGHLDEIRGAWHNLADKK